MQKNRKQTQLLSYFGGLFDGEGTVGAYHSNGTFKLRLAVHNQFFYPLGLIAKEFPGGVLRQGNADVWALAYNHFKAQEVMETLLPYTIIKYEQLKVGISFLNHRRRDHRTRTPGVVCKRCAHHTETLKRLKNCNGVNSVNPMREYRAKPEDVEQDAAFVLSLLEGVETSAEASTSQ